MSLQRQPLEAIGVAGREPESPPEQTVSEASDSSAGGQVLLSCMKFTPCSVVV